jgi:hypothetical protein
MPRSVGLINSYSALLTAEFMKDTHDEDVRDNLAKSGLAEFYRQLAENLLDLSEQKKTRQKPWEKDPCVYHGYCGKSMGYSCTIKVRTSTLIPRLCDMIS